MNVAVKSRARGPKRHRRGLAPASITPHNPPKTPDSPTTPSRQVAKRRPLELSLEGLLARIAALLCFLTFATSAFAQTDSSISAEQKDIGKIQTQIQKYDNALGVVSELIRSAERNVECNGLCLFQNGSKNVTWSCGPKKVCNLFCGVNPPVGGCK